MNKFIALALVLVAVGVGFIVFRKPEPVKPVPQPIPQTGAYRQTADHFANGFYAGTSDQFFVSSTGTLVTSGDIVAPTSRMSGAITSSSSPAALGSSTVGKFVIAASATTAQASTTALTVNSLVFFVQSATTTIPGTTCNTATASGTLVSQKIVGNGFQIRTNIAPTTNPFCFDFYILN